MTGQLLSLQVGKPKRLCTPETMRVDTGPPFWTSGIYKDPVAGPVWVSAEAIAGDGVADSVFHGGPDNVVLAYDAAHYPQWRRELELPDLPFGGFGENFTVEGFTDQSVCVGDIWRVGDGPDALVLQVTQPRQPCSKLARRLQRPEIVKLVKQRGWGGWYLRVLHEGHAEAGMPITRIERLHAEWPVAVAVQVMYARKKQTEQARALAALPILSRRWKQELIDE